MQNFISTTHNKLPLGNFTSKVSSCGGQAKSIDILIRGLSWANKLSPTQACDRAVEDYFDSPGIHFNFLCKFWHPDGNASSKKPTDNNTKSNPFNDIMGQFENLKKEENPFTKNQDKVDIEEDIYVDFEEVDNDDETKNT